MPFYNDLRPADDFISRDYLQVFPHMNDTEKKRCIEGLLRLKTGLKQLPPKRVDKNLLIASFNIKEFGHTTQRLPEAYFYLAEIISHFDLVAIQEIKSTLYDLKRLMRLLGSNWEYVINDITNGDNGNAERSGYLYDRNRVKMSGLAGEISLWDELTKNSPLKQLKRTPYITGFKAGWKSFALINLHLHPSDGSDTTFGTDAHYRAEEVRLLLEALKIKKAKNQLWTQNLILLGDFNFYDGSPVDQATIQSLANADYEQLDSLVGVDTNASKTEAYDRFFITQNNYFTVEKKQNSMSSAGVFDPFAFVYRDTDHAIYADFMRAHYTGEKPPQEFEEYMPRYYKHPWRKNQLSDHFPIWFELCIDSSEKFLESKLQAFE